MQLNIILSLDPWQTQVRKTEKKSNFVIVELAIKITKMVCCLILTVNEYPDMVDVSLFKTGLVNTFHR